MYTARLNRTIGPPWTRVEPIMLGRIPSGLGTPDVHLSVEQDGEPLLRADLYLGDETHCFSQAEVWHEHAVVGFGEHVRLIDLNSRKTTSIRLGSYFGSLLCLNHCLLVASADSVFCIGTTGQIIWTSEKVGIDGVAINRVDRGIIEGEGEWDPPGGWRPFKISLKDGTSV